MGFSSSQGVVGDEEGEAQVEDKEKEKKEEEEEDSFSVSYSSSSSSPTKAPRLNLQTKLTAPNTKVPTKPNTTPQTGCSQLVGQTNAHK